MGDDNNLFVVILTSYTLIGDDNNLFCCNPDVTDIILILFSKAYKNNQACCICTVPQDRNVKNIGF